MFGTQMDFEAHQPDTNAWAHDQYDDCSYENPTPQPAKRRKPAMFILTAMIGFWASFWSYPSSMHTAPPMHELESRLPGNDGAKKIFVTLDSDSGAESQTGNFHSLIKLHTSASITCGYHAEHMTWIFNSITSIGNSGCILQRCTASTASLLQESQCVPKTRRLQSMSPSFWPSQSLGLAALTSHMRASTLTCRHTLQIQWSIMITGNCWQGWIPIKRYAKSPFHDC